MKKGTIQIIPILILSLALASGFIAVAISRSQPQTNPQVLSSSDDSDGGDDNSGSNSGSSGSGSSDSGSHSSESSDSNNNQQQTSNTSGSQNTSKVESKTDDSRVKVVNTTKKTEVETENADSRLETKIEDDKQESKLRIGGLRIEYKVEDGKIVTKVKNENDEEVELEDEQENELLDKTETELEDDDIKIATDSASLGIIQNGNKTRTNFPLTINPQTGELTVSTPKGDKVVAILPNQAIQNMIAAGFPIIETINPTETESTESAQLEPTNSTLTQVNDDLAYVIKAAKNERFLGLLPVKITVEGVISAEDGSLLDLRRSSFSSLLDLLSF